jgi:hypothetical protein
MARETEQVVTLTQNQKEEIDECVSKMPYSGLPGRILMYMAD